MKKQFLLSKLFFITVILYNPSIVLAEEYKNKWLYVSARGIINTMKVTGSDAATLGMKATTMQFGAGLSVGLYHRLKYISMRYEIDYNYTMRSNSFYHAVMTNIYISPSYGNNVLTPYVMGGIGINIFDPPFAVINSNFGWNVGAGISVPIKKNWAIDFGFRYMQTDINFNIEGTQSAKNHNFYIGFIYIF